MSHWPAEPTEAMDTSSPPPPPLPLPPGGTGAMTGGGCASPTPASIQEKMTREFQTWRDSHPPPPPNPEEHPPARPIQLKLKQCNVDHDDGKTSLVFDLDGKQAFTLHCPYQYPDYESEDNFFVEADSGLQLWCNALNEYLLDSDSRLSLAVILQKGLSLYSSADRPSGSMSKSMASTSSSSWSRSLGARPRTFSSRRTSQPEINSDEEDDDDEDEFDEDLEEEMYEEDGGVGDDDQLEDILDNDLSWELEISRRKKRWRQREIELRAEMGRLSDGGGLGNDDKTLQQIFHDPSTKTRQPKQVFSSTAASGILTNDLVSIMESAKTTGIDADTINDNIFQWNVKIRDFSSNCVLDKDFQTLKAKFNYDYIELQLDFSMDLYPFFPPLVKVIRPRLQGSMMLRVTTMEILKLTYWNPAKDMKALLMDIKSFLQTWARLDLSSDRNDRNRYPDGAYIDIEHHLLRLALVSEIVPRANKKYAVVTPTHKASLLPASALETVKEVKKKSSKKPNHHSEEGPSTSGLGAEVLGAMGASGGGALDLKMDESESKPVVGDKKLKKLQMFLQRDRQSKDEKKKASEKVKLMAKGVGYSRYQQKGWDVKAYMAAQREKDKQIELVLGKIHQELKKLHGSYPASNGGVHRNFSELLEGATAGIVSSSSSSDNVSNSTSSEAEGRSSNGPTIDREGSRRKRKHSPDDVNDPTAAGGVSTSSANNGASSPIDSIDSQPEPSDFVESDEHEKDEEARSSRKSSSHETPIDPLSDLYAVLEGSALIPFLEMKLQANSFLEICSHATVYKCVVSIIREMVSQTYLVPLLGPLPDQQFSISTLLECLSSQAKILLDKIGKASANGSVPKSGKAAEKLSDKTTDDRLAKDFLLLSKEVDHALASVAAESSVNGESSSLAEALANNHSSSNSSSGSNHGRAHVGSSGSSAGGNNTDACNAASSSTNASQYPLPGTSDVDVKRKSRKDKAADLYKAHMKTLQLDSYDFATSGSQVHAHMTQFQRAGTPNSQIIFRVAQEISSFSTSLPLDFSSAIFVRADDEKTPLIKAIITGPEDTPYTGGCYLFDIYFPLKYPQVPPQVTFRTTGNGTVRFNPNLYNCGRVCLSLLGTWEGAQGEQWNETSTILQVLISIQSLILCSEPYYNEPGYERLYGTPQGNAESLKYSEEVFRNNLKFAILAQVQNPPEGFEEVIKAHFFLKRHILLKELESMLDKYKGKDVKKYFLDVKRELMKLEQPPNLKKSFLTANQCEPHRISQTSQSIDG
ncbi:uncharacterized protein LOC131876889 [Tigriopus californicus]|uniref:uncharacterized protein LOC131876889 n=1 Tax=Tigriopus californicus TaxID=6832 RepID=UPI0027DA941B|nr:uncharacterized protein LOC131876889 [Tigriopus californicus]